VAEGIQDHAHRYELLLFAACARLFAFFLVRVSKGSVCRQVEHVLPVEDLRQALDEHLVAVVQQHVIYSLACGEVEGQVRRVVVQQQLHVVASL